MGRCICRSDPEDYGEWCERYEDTIKERVHEKYDTVNAPEAQMSKWFDEEAQKLWDDCPEPEDYDPKGGDGDDD